MKDTIKEIANLLHSDVAFEADCIASGITKAEPREKNIAKLLIEIYKIVHPLTSECCKRKDERKPM